MYSKSAKPNAPGVFSEPQVGPPERGRMGGQCTPPPDGGYKGEPQKNIFFMMGVSA